ncbi:MAG: Co2+/Mg2+ efflux protein ApaG [Xanthomonadales bacterium]|nr:Co2+/Mg2+ efflux protein ApaG [Xanthomonadales bacterium]
MDAPDYDIDINVHSQFVPDQSRPGKERFVFAYTVTLRNKGAMPAQLLSRHWIIHDSNGKTEEVRGDGVIGEQPWMRPGEDYQYSSSAVLATSVGTMRGTYFMQAEDGTRFDAPIPPFVLSIPRTLH